MTKVSTKRRHEAPAFGYGAMTVIEIAQRAEVAPHVVRYYARIGMLKPSRHQDNGYKLFASEDVNRLRFIRQAQSLGFTLAEIGKIFDEVDHGKSPCPRVREILAGRIDENRRKLDEIVALQTRMEKALKAWRRLPDGVPEGHIVCHLIESAGKF
jgi:DNA-binding transcriptional MerR regulator